jgi:hypothetical protein
MSRRRLHWRRYGKDASMFLPASHVKGTGRTKYAESGRPGSGVGQTVTRPASERRRELVTRWTETKRR